MSKMRCECGNSIYDQSDNLPNKGKIIRDQDRNRLMQSLVSRIESFIETISMGTRDKWVAERIDYKPASEVNTEEVLHFLFSSMMAMELDIFQCLTCGNVMIETDAFSNKFVSYRPSEGKGFLEASILQSTAGK
ncbi:MAG: hypothetical protein SF339_23760 [Blastocatellia bacterium]|nr:hypothetical protein [Blastocatellia bacterium]